MSLDPTFSYFDKAPPNADPTVPAKLEIKPGSWRRMTYQGHGTGALEDGRSILTRQFYAEDFTDANLPSDIRSRLVRLKPGTAADYTDEVNHVVAIDWQASHTVEMATRADTPIAVEILVTGPGSIFLTAWGFRGISVNGIARAEIRSALAAALEVAS